MSGGQDHNFSAEFVASANSERKKKIRRIATLRDGLDRHRAEIRRIEAELKIHESQLRDIEDLLGVAPQMRLEGVSDRLGGRALRERAVQLLIENAIFEPVHYSKWFDLMQSEGLKVAGKDPLATFLTQISRDARVEPVGGKTGLYQLKPVAVSAQHK